MQISTILNNVLLNSDKNDVKEWSNYIAKNLPLLYGINFVNGAAYIQANRFKCKFDNNNNILEFYTDMDLDNFKMVVMGNATPIMQTSILTLSGDVINSDFKLNDSRFNKRFWFSNFVVEWDSK